MPRVTRSRVAAFGGPTYHQIYNELPCSFLANPDRHVTTEVRRRADVVFDNDLRRSEFISTYKLEYKRQLFQLLYATGVEAVYLRGTVGFNRAKSHSWFTPAWSQIIKASITAELFDEYRSPKGSPRMSRLLPTEAFLSTLDLDPWEFLPGLKHGLVTIRERETKQELPYAEDHPTAIEYRTKLELINIVNRKSIITARRQQRWANDYGPRQILTPVHFAVFTDSFDLHGRLYTSTGGHQALTKKERSTTQFDGQPAAELDYGSFHPRLLYHLHQMDNQDDLYALWRGDTTPPQRLLAKVLLYALINATSEVAAISAANRSQLMKWESGEPKTGKAKQDAEMIQLALKKTGLSFGHDILPLVYLRHARLRPYFHRDFGMKLMNFDGRLALNIMHLFAGVHIPILGVHDGFLVPRQYRQRLRETMMDQYFVMTGYYPTVTDKEMRDD